MRHRPRRMALAAAALLALAGGRASAGPPDEPRVIDSMAEIGKPGGEIRTLIGRARDVRLYNVYGYARLVAYDRDLKLAVQWTREGNEPSAEVLLVVEARRGKSEDSTHKGRYALTVTVPDTIPGGDGKPKKASGRAVCSAE